MSRTDCRAGMAALLVAAGATWQISKAQPVFWDDFEDLSVLWGNQRGNWKVVGGRYGAHAPDNNPLTFSSMPYSFGDLELECDVIAADDGGVWLHADDSGENGVLLVLAHGAIYWHSVVNGGTPETFGEVSNAFATGQDLHLRVTVSGGTFSAYLNGAQTPITTHTTAMYPSGRVALYDFRSPAHNYDNVVLSGVCVGGTCCGLVSRHPDSLTVCAQGTAELSVSMAGSGPFHYRWQAFVGGSWCDLTDLQYGGGCLADSSALFQGVGSDTLTITGVSEADEAEYRCRITDSCGQVFSDGAALAVCPPDFDCDGFVSGQDFDAYVLAFEAGDLGADFDGDGFITGIDYDLYVQSFETGC